MAVFGVRGVIRFRTRRLRKIVNPAPRDVLVVLLSDLRFELNTTHAIKALVATPRHDDPEWSRLLLETFVPKLDEGSLGLTDLGVDLKALAAAKKRRGHPKWPWEQPLRAIMHGHNAERRLRLVVVCSKESVQQVGLFAQLILQYRLNVDVSFLLRQAEDKHLLQPMERCHDVFRFSKDQGWDFDDFDQLYDCMRGMLQQLTSMHIDGRVISDRDIAIDLTGGTKPASVVAALVTVDRPIVNQYVTTDPRDKTADEWTYEIFGYDITHE